MNIHIKDIATGEVMTWTLDQVLEEINRDRSGAWIDYDENDWEEGWDEWCEGDFYTLIGVCYNNNGLTGGGKRDFNCDFCLNDIKNGDMYELDGVQVCKECYPEKS
jgi:hypothetical protein